MTNVQLLSDLRDFVSTVHMGEWGAERLLMRDLLMKRLDEEIAKAREREVLESGLRGMFAKWFGRKEQ